MTRQPQTQPPTTEAPYSARFAALSVRDPYLRWRHFAVGRGSPGERALATPSQWNGHAHGSWRAR